MGDKPTEFGKIVLKSQKMCENNYARYMLKQLFTSLSVNNVDIYRAAKRQSKYPPLLTAISVNFSICVCVCVCVCVCIKIYLYMFVCTYVYMYICLYVYAYVYGHATDFSVSPD